MAKKRLTSTAIKGTFIKNRTFPSHFERAHTSTDFPFSNFTISTPKESYLNQQGAVFVAECIQSGKKILHTGLRGTCERGVFAGDMYEPANKKKSLVLFREVQGLNGYEVYYFDGYYPRSINRTVKQTIRL